MGKTWRHAVNVYVCVCQPSKAAVFYSKQVGSAQLSQTILVYPAPSPVVGWPLARRGDSVAAGGRVGAGTVPF